jgi:hypothetical protein
MEELDKKRQKLSEAIDETTEDFRSGFKGLVDNLKESNIEIAATVANARGTSKNTFAGLTQSSNLVKISSNLNRLLDEGAAAISESGLDQLRDTFKGLDLDGLAASSEKLKIAQVKLADSQAELTKAEESKNEESIKAAEKLVKESKDRLNDELELRESYNAKVKKGLDKLNNDSSLGNFSSSFKDLTNGMIDISGTLDKSVKMINNVGTVLSLGKEKDILGSITEKFSKSFGKAKQEDTPASGQPKSGSLETLANVSEAGRLTTAAKESVKTGRAGLSKGKELASKLIDKNQGLSDMRSALRMRKSEKIKKAFQVKEEKEFNKQHTFNKKANRFQNNQTGKFAKASKASLKTQKGIGNKLLSIGKTIGSVAKILMGSLLLMLAGIAIILAPLIALGFMVKKALESDAFAGIGVAIQKFTEGFGKVLTKGTEVFKKGFAKAANIFNKKPVTAPKPKIPKNTKIGIPKVADPTAKVFDMDGKEIKPKAKVVDIKTGKTPTAKGPGTTMAKGLKTVAKKAVKKLPVIGGAIETAMDGSANLDKFEKIKEAYESGELDISPEQFEKLEAANKANLAGSVGKGLGSVGGGLAGAAAGATIGSVVHVVGTIIGGIVGGVIGSIWGGKAGDSIATTAAEGVVGGSDSQKLIDDIAAQLKSQEAAVLSAPEIQQDIPRSAEKIKSMNEEVQTAKRGREIPSNTVMTSSSQNVSNQSNVTNISQSPVVNDSDSSSKLGYVI